MPIVSGKYKNPGWINNQRPPINSSELNAICETVEKLDSVGAEGVTSFNGRTEAVTPQEGDYTAAMVGARPDTWMPTAAQVGAVPTSRTVNGKGLGKDISLSAKDVGARPDTWTPITYGTSDLVAGSSELETGTIYLVYQ